MTADSSGELSFQIGGSAPERYDEFVAPIMAPFVAALVDRAALEPGAMVIDLACGTGFVARAAAARVGSDGHVVGIDVNPGMLAVARRRAEGFVPAIEWREAPADALPVGDGAFDAVLCEQGLQFFPDLAGALAEVVRVLRPGGRVVATVWAALDRSPYMAAQREAIRHVIGDDHIAPFDAAFSCDATRLVDAFAGAGLRNIETEEVVADIRLPPLESFAAGHLAALPWGAALLAARPDGLEVAAGAISEALAEFTAPDGWVTTPFASILAIATR